MKNRKVRVLAVLVGVAIVLWFAHARIFWAMGQALINQEPPVKADLAIVLAGDGWGNRVLKGADLVKNGYAPVALISNGGEWYGQVESDMAKAFAVKHGYPESSMIAAPWLTYSTAEEGRRAIQFARDRGAHRILLVTTLWHTARALRIYKRLAPDLEFHMVGARDKFWYDGYWWQHREGRKTFFFEAAKTVADRFGGF